MRLDPLAAPLVLLLISRVHDPTGIFPTAGSAVQLSRHIAMCAHLRTVFCAVHNHQVLNECHSRKTDAFDYPKRTRIDGLRPDMMKARSKAQG